MSISYKLQLQLADQIQAVLRNGANSVEQALLRAWINEVPSKVYQHIGMSAIETDQRRQTLADVSRKLIAELRKVQQSRQLTTDESYRLTTYQSWCHSATVAKQQIRLATNDANRKMATHVDKNPKAFWGEEEHVMRDAYSRKPVTYSQPDANTVPMAEATGYGVVCHSDGFTTNRQPFKSTLSVVAHREADRQERAEGRRNGTVSRGKRGRKK
jgi:hypothetical protein